MKRHHLGISGLIISVFLITCFLYSAKPVAAQQSAAAEKAQSTYSPDEILVKTKKGIKSYSVKAVKGAFILRQHTKSSVSTVKLPPGTDLQAAIKKYKADPSVEYAEPNYLRQLNFEPNDPYLEQQWYIDKIRAKEAWDITKGNNQVVVAVIDSGVDYGHPDLQDKIVSPYNSMINSTSLADVMDDGGHGTIVAGEVAGALDNSVGIAGDGGNIKVMPIKAGDMYGLYDSDIATGIYWAVDNGARVINMSLGGTSYSNTLLDAVNYAISHNVVVIAAAGNENTDVPNYPAAFPGVIGVAATTMTDEPATFSNYGSYIDICAPGVDIFSTTPRSGTNDTAAYYDWADGTSMAAPIVAGVAGLILSVNPDLSSTQVVDAIYDGAQDLGPQGWDEYTGWGRVDAFKTLNLLVPPTMTSINPINNSSDVSIYKTITANFSEDILAGPNFSAITLKDETNNMVPVNNSISQRTLSIKPVNPLSFGKNYTLTIPAGAITDTVNNSLQANYTTGFSTESYLHLIQLPFQVTDAVYDAAYSVMYATNKAQKKLYAVNVNTGSISTMDFVYMPESLELGQGAYSNELYVALLHREHDYTWWDEDQYGSIGIIDRSSFSLTGTMSIQIDPYDIVAGRDGYLYIPSGSGQWSNLDAYDRAIGRLTGRKFPFDWQSVAKLHPSLDKIYFVDTTSSPRDHQTVNISNGTFGTFYNSPYHGDYPLNTNFAISPTGLLINGSGVIFSTSADSVDDMVYLANIGTSFTDIAFEDDSPYFYTLIPNTHDINVYNAVYFNYLDKLNIEGKGKRLFNGGNSLTALFEPDSPSADYMMGIQILPKYSDPSANLGTGSDISGDEGSGPVVSSVSLDSDSYSLNVGNTHQTVVTAVYSDNSLPDVTQYASYNSSNPLVAIVSQSGLVTAIGQGSTVITATYGGHSAQASVTVLSPAPVTTPGGGGGGAVVASNGESEIKETVPNSGGTVSSNDHRVTVEIPVGALDPGTSLPLTAKPVPPAEIKTPEPAGLQLVSDAFEFGPNGRQFLKPVRITLKYDVQKVGSGEVAPYYLNELNSTWEIVANATVDKSKGTVTFETTHFSKYAIMGKPAQALKTFDDITNHWAKADIEYIASQGIVSGKTNKLFDPDGKVTRAEFARMLVGALGLTPEKGNKTFSDVNENAWYYQWVETAAKAGIIVGSNGKFRPGDLVTREEIAVMIVKALAVKNKTLTGSEADLVQFDDRGAISGWARSAMGQAVNYKVVSGRTKTKLAPVDNTTRAEAAVMVKKLLGIL